VVYSTALPCRGALACPNLDSRPNLVSQARLDIGAMSSIPLRSCISTTLRNRGILDIGILTESFIWNTYHAAEGRTASMSHPGKAYATW
jgi:hypothetical protein